MSAARLIAGLADVPPNKVEKAPELPHEEVRTPW